MYHSRLLLLTLRRCCLVGSRSSLSERALFELYQNACHVVTANATYKNEELLNVLAVY